MLIPEMATAIAWSLLAESSFSQGRLRLTAWMEPEVRMRGTLISCDSYWSRSGRMPRLRIVSPSIVEFSSYGSGQGYIEEEMELVFESRKDELL